MEDVPGVPGPVLRLVSYPEDEVRNSLPPSEWQACLDVWLSTLEHRLRLQAKEFEKVVASGRGGDVAFITSYLQSSPLQQTSTQTTNARFQRWTYLHLRRLLLETPLVSDSGSFSVQKYVINAAPHFAHFSDWPNLLAALTRRFPKQISAGFDAWKSAITRHLDSKDLLSHATVALSALKPLLRSWPEAGVKLMTGSDYLETLMTTFARQSTTPYSQDAHRIIAEHLFLCLRSLMSDKARHPSLLLDHLYLLKSEADSRTKAKSEAPTVLVSILSTTSFLRHLAGDASVVDSKRGREMLETLSAYREQTRHLFPVPAFRKAKVDKGKRKAQTGDEMHMHQAAQVSQIHELFPDLPTTYILRLLDHFGNDVEQVTAALLEPSSLPPALQDPHQEPEVPSNTGKKDLAPRSTPPMLPQRKNVFDDDDFDKLRISEQQLHRGRKTINIDNVNSPEEHNRSKAAIMSALAAFDSDDDERDDSYDVADVGGSVDQSVDTDNRPRPQRAAEQNPQEEVLYRAWKDSSALFARDSKTRMSPIRQDMKRQTGMGDEQIEGWAIMLAKDPVLQRRLQQKYSMMSTFTGNRHNLQQTRWQQNASADTSMDEGAGNSSDTGDESGRGERSTNRGFSYRGRGAGRGGSVINPGTPQAPGQGGRGRGRGRGGGRANHNRREGRARKMGRGMGGGPAPT